MSGRSWRRMRTRRCGHCRCTAASARVLRRRPELRARAQPLGIVALSAGSVHVGLPGKAVSPAPSITAAADAGSTGTAGRARQPPPAAPVPAPHRGARPHDGARCALLQWGCKLRGVEPGGMSQSGRLRGWLPALHCPRQPSIATLASTPTELAPLACRRSGHQRRPGAEPEAGRRDPEVGAERRSSNGACSAFQQDSGPARHALPPFKLCGCIALVRIPAGSRVAPCPLGACHVCSDRVQRALQLCPRDHFVPPAHRDEALIE